MQLQMNSTQGEGVSCEAKPRKQGNEAKKFGEEGEERNCESWIELMRDGLILSSSTQPPQKQTVVTGCVSQVSAFCCCFRDSEEDEVSKVVSCIRLSPKGYTRAP